MSERLDTDVGRTGPWTAAPASAGVGSGENDGSAVHAARLDVLSPELVLVDPLLAAEARRRLPDPPDCLTPRVRALVHGHEERWDVSAVRRSRTWASGGSSTTPLGSGLPNDSAGTLLSQLPSVAPTTSGRRPVPVPAPVLVEEQKRVRPSMFAIVVMLLVALAIGLPSFDLVPWSSAELPSFVENDEQGAATTSAGADLVLEWPRAENATLYDVVLWRGGRRMLDLWPETNRVDVRDAVARSGKRLVPGTYQWFAFAGFGSRDDLRFGKVLANGTFTVE